MTLSTLKNLWHKLTLTFNELITYNGNQNRIKTEKVYVRVNKKPFER